MSATEGPLPTRITDRIVRVREQRVLLDHDLAAPPEPAKRRRTGFVQD